MKFKRRTGRVHKVPASIRFMSILFMVLFATGTLPLAIAQEKEEGGFNLVEETADYGIYERMDSLTAEMDEHINSKEILGETKQVMDNLIEEDFQTHNRIPTSYEIRDSRMDDPRLEYPPIFDDIEYGNDIITHQTIWDWILPQPMTDEGLLNYWAVLNYEESNSKTVSNWKQGSIMPRLVFTDSGLDKWIHFDIDNNSATGDMAGNDMGVRISFYRDNIRFNPLSLPLSVSFTGGLRVDMQGLGPGFTDPNPLVAKDRPVELDIIKAFSYDGNNYIFTITLKLEELLQPQEDLSIFIGSEKITVGNILGSVGSIITGGDGSFTNISGPYFLNYETSKNIESLKATIGIMKLYNAELIDKTWIKLGFFRGQGYDHIPKDGELWLNSENIYSPIDILLWTAGKRDRDESRIPVELRLEYCEELENLTYAKLEIRDLPPFLNVTLDYSQQKFGKDVTIIDYRASDVIDYLEFTTYQFYRNNLNEFDMDLYTTTSVKIRHIPTRLHAEVTSDLGRGFDPTVYNNPTYSPLGNLLDNVIGRVAGRVYRLGMVLRALPENMMTLPAREGWLIADMYNGYIGDIQFSQTSGNYIHNPERNFVGFLRDHSVDHHTHPKIGEYSFSGRVKNIKYIKADFTTQTRIEFDSFGHESLDALSLDNDDYVYAEISNLPDHLDLQIVDNQFFYRTDPADYTDPDNKIHYISFYSTIGETFLNLDIYNLPGDFSMGKVGERITLDCGDDFIDMLEFSISDKKGLPIKRIKDGNFFYIYKGEKLSFASGRIFGLQNLDYDTSENGFLSLRIKEESAMKIKVIDEKDENIDVQAVLDPFPTFFSVNLPSIVNTSIIRFPDIVNITGIKDYGSMLFSIAGMADKILGILNNVSASILGSIGGIGTDFSFSYDLNTDASSMNLVAVLKKGRYDDLDKVDWTHGICMNQRVRGDDIDFYGNIYLQGLPSQAEIEMRISKDVLTLGLDFKNYNPKYPWLIINTKGMQEQDVVAYLSGLSPNINMDINVDMYTNMNVGGKITGDIDLHLTNQQGEIVNLEQIYIRFRKYATITSIREAYLPNVPGILKATFNIEEELFVDYNASMPIEYLFIKLSKSLSGKWSNTIVILHDVPNHFIARLTSNTDFEIVKPLPFQNIPNFDLRTFNSNTMDLFLSVDGSGFGQRGKYQIYLRDIGDKTSGTLISDTLYDFISVGGVGYMDLTVRNLRLVDQLEINSMSLRGQDLRSFRINIYMLFGMYPIFQMYDVNGRALQMELHTTFYLGDKGLVTKIMIVDIAFRTIGPAEIPTEFPMATDRFSVDMEKHPRHVLLPIPQPSALPLV